MEYTIRHIHKKDREAVEKICIATGPAQAEASEDMRKLLLTVFCHYYIEQEPEHCFVAVNDQDEAVGYVLCAHDFEKWKDCFEKEYLKKQENPMIAMVGRGTIDDLAPYAGEYPAHLHIDLLPECQRIGLGTPLLMEPWPKSPVAMPPQIPPMPWHPKASRASSIFSFFLISFTPK